MDKVNHYKIVLAEDDEDDRTFFRDAIKKLHPSATVNISNDGEKLLTYLAQLNDDAMPDIIFLDLHMPRINGIQCICEIRANEKFNGIPIVMFTISGLAPDIKETKRCGANMYIKKSGSFALLMETLRQVLTDEGFKSLLMRRQGYLN
jgi:CheY-like chemotaxis protein